MSVAVPPIVDTTTSAGPAVPGGAVTVIDVGVSAFTVAGVDDDAAASGNRTGRRIDRSDSGRTDEGVLAARRVAV